MAVLASMSLVSLISVGVIALYMACNGAGDILEPAKTAVNVMPEAEGYEPARPAQAAPAADSSIVYFTKEITPEGLMAAYRALGQSPATGNKVAVKLSTGEPPNSNYLRSALIKDFIQSFNNNANSNTVSIVECNTVYPGTQRGTTAAHRQVAQQHGFTAIATVDIMDENGSLSIPAVSGGRLKGENFVGKNFANYDYYVVLSHFKGHAMAGLGGAIKNISIGIGSTEGKCWIHTHGTSKTSFSGGQQNPFEESMAEAGKAVVDYLKSRDRKIMFVNVMNKLSVDCDCFGNPAAVEMADIGILSSLDPVALDQACVDLVKKAKDGTKLVNRMTEKNGYLMISHGGVIGLGSQTYKIVNLDDNSTSITVPERVAPACELHRPK
jgi:uncharacterized Fe-S center protein